MNVLQDNISQQYTDFQLGSLLFSLHLKIKLPTLTSVDIKNTVQMSYYISVKLESVQYMNNKIHVVCLSVSACVYFLYLSLIQSWERVIP